MPEQPTPHPAEALIGFIDSIGQLVEAVAGYRKKCEEAGFSPTAAEAMSVELHRHMIAAAFKQAAS